MLNPRSSEQNDSIRHSKKLDHESREAQNGTAGIQLSLIEVEAKFDLVLLTYSPRRGNLVGFSTLIRYKNRLGVGK